MKTLPLTKGKMALVDDEDYEKLSAFKWHDHGQGHPARSVRLPNGKRATVFLYNLLMPPPDGFFVDHKNVDPTDNRRENLRLSTRSQNNSNCLKRKDNTSGFKGVSFKKEFQLFFSRIQVKGRRIHLGYFNTAEQAYEAYCKAAPIHHGEFARVA